MWPFNNTNQQQPTQQPTQQPIQQQQSAQQQPPKPEPKGLDKFAHLLDNATQQGQQGQAQKQKPIQVTELFKNEQFVGNLRQNIRSNLTQALTPELRQKMASNDPEAMLEVFTALGEAAYLQSLEHSTSLQNLALSSKMEEFQDSTSRTVDTKLQKHQLTSAMPQLNNPIVQLGVQAFMDKVLEQNPATSPDEMKAQVTEYLQELSKDFGVGSTEDQDNQANDTDQGIDWFKELGIPSGDETPPT
jgi:hypothetical protein